MNEPWPRIFLSRPARRTSRPLQRKAWKPANIRSVSIRSQEYKGRKEVWIAEYSGGRLLSLFTSRHPHRPQHEVISNLHAPWSSPPMTECLQAYSHLLGGLLPDRHT